MENLLHILSNVPLFKPIEIEELETLIENAHYKILSYPKGQLVFQSGEKVDKLIVLIEGKITAEMLDPSGKALKIEDAVAPQTLGSAFMYGPKQKLPVNVTAKTDCKFLFITKPDFQKIMMQSEKLMAYFEQES